ncbi:MAG TPA: hybrid sensor histidine kinase/response regulator, partial [Actinomycetota bacterium]
LGPDPRAANAAAPEAAQPPPTPRPTPGSAWLAREHQPASVPDPPSATSSTEDTIRIRTGKLDALMADVGELVVTRIAVEQRLTEVRVLEASLADWESSLRKLRHLGQEAAGEERAILLAAHGEGHLEVTRRDLGHLRRMLEADARRMAQVATDLQDDVRRTRMLPVGTVFGGFPRMVRDLAREQGKEVALSIAGGGIEVDRSVLEQIKDPLMHLLRNCVDHGIESPDARARAGKPTPGTISVSARQRGDSLLVEVADDGAGIDVEAVRTRAVEMGLLTPAAAGDLSEREAVTLIFRPGLSSSPRITDVSGRGVGLDVVRDAVERLHGSVEVASRAGLGATFSLSLPLSVSTMLCLLIEAGGQTFALPASGVERIIRVGPDEIEWAGGRETARVDGHPVVLAGLDDVLGVEAAPGDDNPASRQPVVVAGTAERRAAFLVDHVSGTHELVVKSLPAPLLRVRCVTGATVLGSGEVAMILSAAELMAALERSDGPSLAATRTPATEPATVLVVEDSVTTRTLERNILETAGFRVRVAADGAEGWDRLQSGSCNLVLTDIEMPRMDGFELVTRIRADQRHRELPVVLVTSRDSREDRERSIQAGADAYIVKGGFDQDRLLETIRRLI